MTFAFARSKYQQVEQVGAPQIENPYQIVLITLQELSRSLKVLYLNKNDGVAYSDDHISRSFTAIYILQSSLDFEQGDDLAKNLFQVYEYGRQQVLKAFRKDETANLEQAYKSIEGILSAWQEIAAEVDAG